MKKMLLSALFLSILQSVLFWEKDKGISVILFLIPFIIIIYYNIKKSVENINKKALLWSIPIFLLGITYFIFNNTFFRIINIPVILGLVIIMCIELTEGKIVQERFIRKILEKIFKPFSISIKTIKKLDIIKSIKSKKELEDKKIIFIKKLVKSILIGIPLVLIIIVLLSSADSIFGNIFNNLQNNISKIFESKKVIDFIWRCGIIIIAFIYTLGLIVLFTTKEDKETKLKETTKKQGVSLFTMNTILIMINIIYLVFSIIQFKYLFFEAGKTNNFDYANYARTGFFQLMIVSFINFALLKISKYEREEKLNKTLKILLVIFTIVILLSAAFRMYLYEQEYGYTYLRLFVYFILVTELLILIPLLVKILGKNIDTFRISIKIIVTVYIVLNFINIDALIVRNNVNKYKQDLENNKLDIYYLTIATRTDSIQEKLKILDISTEGLSEKAKDDLQNKKNSIKTNLKTYSILYGDNYKYSYQEWNLSKNKVHKLLKNIDLSIENTYNY